MLLQQSYLAAPRTSRAVWKMGISALSDRTVLHNSAERGFRPGADRRRPGPPDDFSGPRRPGRENVCAVPQAGSPRWPDVSKLRSKPAPRCDQRPAGRTGRRAAAGTAPVHRRDGRSRLRSSATHSGTDVDGIVNPCPQQTIMTKRTETPDPYPTEDEIADRVFERLMDAHVSRSGAGDCWTAAETELLERAATRLLRSTNAAFRQTRRRGR